MKNEKKVRAAKARSAGMTKEERSASAQKAAIARWGEKATHEGILEIGEISIQCYVLESGERVLSQRGIVASLNMGRGSNRLIRFAESTVLSPYMDEKSLARIRNPIRFRQPRGGPEAHGYPAQVLSDLCHALLSARREGTLLQRQEHIAEVAEVLMMGFAQVGIIALVDEATGYQYDRARNALAKILEDFVQKEAARWAKTFSDEYFIHHARLRNLNFRHDRKAPLAGKDTADIVYKRLAPGVLEELRKVNSGKKKKHHQFLTPEHGHPKLREHIASVVTLMKVSKTWRQFKDLLDMAHPRYDKTLPLFGVETSPGTIAAPDP